MAAPLHHRHARFQRRQAHRPRRHYRRRLVRLEIRPAGRSGAACAQGGDRTPARGCAVRAESPNRESGEMLRLRHLCAVTRRARLRPRRLSVAALRRRWRRARARLRASRRSSCGYRTTGRSRAASSSSPTTTLRALGPKPWSAAYVQPSRRPSDGRYGENPNRLQHYYQYQVILKPAPQNSQVLYLESLAALGIDARRHDIRFVEDDWESPTLGAWGLGWEVWLDGMEVTQFTYFQQVGGIECDPVSTELTYGLERLAMYVQGKESIYDLDYNGAPGAANITYGQVFKRAEREFSAYNFEIADTA